jgi:hypothetical protein
MRDKIICWFMADHPEEITEGQEIAFYCIMGFPLFIAVATILIIL